MIKTHLNLDPGLDWKLGQPSWAYFYTEGPICCPSLGPSTDLISRVP